MVDICDDTASSSDNPAGEASLTSPCCKFFPACKLNTWQPNACLYIFQYLQLYLQHTYSAWWTSISCVFSQIIVVALKTLQHLFVNVGLLA